MKIKKSPALFCHYFGYFLLALFIMACQPAIPEEIVAEMENLPEKVDYNLHVKPILSDRCFACHGNDKAKQKAGLRLDIEENAKGELTENAEKYAIVPKNLGKSQLFHRITAKDSELIMPPLESNLKLTNYEKAILIKWLQGGAAYQPHWAFIPPKKVNPPIAAKEDWIENEIDNFILNKLQEKNWQPTLKADKATLLRRVTFDLTGLPPTIAEIDQFLSDNGEDAYEKVVNRLLTSPHYGERMATDWMDVARFADTHGYTVDRFRDMSPWRDWVIETFNENMPYNDFIVWQIAGDMLPNATKKQVLATGFNRNHQQNMEGGIIGEEFRVEYVADRTNTLGAAFLGVTLECARCHDHKYDPISQKEYYQLFSFFNNVNEAGQISYDNAPPVPTMLLSKEETAATLAFINKKIVAQEQEVKDLARLTKKRFEDWLSQKRPKEKLSKAFPKGMTAFFNFENDQLKNKLNPAQKGEMKQQYAENVFPNFDAGKNGKGLALNGDAWLALGDVGVFNRSMPFSVGLWVKLPKELKNGVIFHKGEGAALYNFKGYHLALKDNKLELLMARTTPYNAIIKYTEQDAIPRNEWIHLAITYDGSSKAKGLKLYLNGQVLATEIVQDNLYKDIVFNRKKEPGLQIGARWRGVGIKGATVDEISVYNKALTELDMLFFLDKNEVERIFKKETSKLSASERIALNNWYLDHYEPKYQRLLKTLQQYRSNHNEIIDTVKEVMVMQEMPNPRPTFILNRGAYDDYGSQVYPATPKSILEMPIDSPKNRLGLAKWLIHPENPLTARVIMNRLWQQIFGKGLVTTTEDFGFQGTLPSHPKLLDWLATDFSASNWNFKKAVKQIVLSATYQQSTKTSVEIGETDKNNVFLARGPSNRLAAEMIRDNVLAASGLLTKKIGGASVKPYQPAGLWKVNGTKYVRDSGDKLYRRSLYTFWKRTIPNPTQGTFDTPSRSNCTVKRQKTSTPLQALILLNDPTFAEAARVMGVAISETGNTKEGIVQAFRKLTGRVPMDGELAILMDLHKVEYQKFSKHPEKLKGWLEIGEAKNPKNIDFAVLAANTIVASTIINSDAMIMKR